MEIQRVFIIFPVLLLCLSQVHTSDYKSLISDVRKELSDLHGDDSGTLKLFDEVVNEAASASGDDLQAKLAKLLKFVKPALKKLMSGDGYLIASGCLDVLAGIAETYGGPVGIPVGKVASFISSILTMMHGEGTKNPSSSVIDVALRNYRQQSLLMQANGAKREFSESIAFIEVLKKSKDITKTKLDILAANVPIYRFSSFLGALEYYISQGAVTRDLQQANKTVDFMLLYSQLVVMRETILTDLCLLYKRGGMSDIADAIANAIKVNKRFAKEHMQFLYHIGPENALVASLYYPIKHTFETQSIWAYNNYFGVVDSRRAIAPGKYRLENVYWNKWSICNRWWTIKAIFRGCFDLKENNIKIIPLKNGYYKLQNKQKKHLYISNTDMGWALSTSDEDPGEQGYLNFIRLRTGSYMISTKRWPDYFIYMESSKNGYIRTWQANPGPQGYWNLVQ